jgi:aconitate hydratase
MGAELGATSSLFPSDDKTLEFLRLMGRESDWQALTADPDCAYDEEIEVDLSALEPLAACPHMPDLVTPVAELAGLKVDQVGIGSCTNSSYSDLSLVAQMFKGQHAAMGMDVLISPGSKQVLAMLAESGELVDLYTAGARVLECTCGPCIGMGGSPVSGGVSVRTFNRNFEGRSGTQDAQVYLVSPLTAARVALDGEFSDPATWGQAPKDKGFPAHIPSIRNLFIFPEADGSKMEVLRGSNIVALKPFTRLPEDLRGEVAIRAGDNITTDHIVPGGAEVSALRSNIPAISRYVFSRLDADFAGRAEAIGTGVIVGGENYGQGSSREHAALGPLHLGIRLVIVKSFARIHRTNLINAGILPLLFADDSGYAQVEQGAKIELDTRDITPGCQSMLRVNGKGEVALKNDLSAVELDIVRAGGLLNYTKNR